MVDEGPGHAASEQAAALHSLVAGCIRAIEQGEPDPFAGVCAGHPDLEPMVRARIERLRSMQLLVADTGAVATIGPYTLVRVIGRGGMGRVYLAIQEQPICREVALKVIRSDVGSDEIIARFEAERQTLALMSHPSIAQVFDAGSTVAGEPYFAMEYVPGPPLTVYAEQQHISIPERLRLFVAVCRAVQHAHDKGVIHRDLKPSNILVATHDGRPLPKVIDFGIAKATGIAADDAPFATRHDQVLGTPEYMSPEQARTGGVDVDVRSDVYSLGVVLYELLTGRLPFDSERLRGAGLRDLERILCEEIPTRPSARAPRTTGTDGRRTTRRLSSDLDWITLRALEKDRERRYPSALALADDIERHLKNEPVDAGPPTFLYRVSKLVRRHRLEMTAAALVLISLVAGLVTSLRFAYQSAERAREAESAQHATSLALDESLEFYELARGVIDRFLLGLGDSRLEAVPQADEVRRELYEDALGYLADLRTRRPLDPRLRASVSISHAQTSGIYDELGRPIEALASAELAAVAADQVVREHPDEPGFARMRASAYNQLGIARGRVGDEAGEELAHRTALSEATRAADADPTGADAALLEAVWNNIATGLRLADPETARLGFERALGAWIDTTPADPETRIRTAQIRSNYADVLATIGDLEAAEAQARRAIDELDHNDRRTEAPLNFAFGVLADVLDRAGQTEDALAVNERSVELWRKRHARHPTTPYYAGGLAGSLGDLAASLARVGRHDEALAMHREAIDLREPLQQAAPDDAKLRFLLSRSWAALGSTYRELANRGGGRARLDDALDALDRAFALAQGAPDQLPDELHDRHSIGVLHVQRGSILAELGHDERALGDFDAGILVLTELVGISPRWVEAHADLATAHSSRVDTLWSLGRNQESEADIRAAVEQIDIARELSPQDRAVRRNWHALRQRMAVSALESGDFDVASRVAEEIGADAPDDRSARLFAAYLLAGCGESSPISARRERFAQRVVEHLKAALELGFEPEPGWDAGTPLAWLRGRDDYDRLFEDR